MCFISDKKCRNNFLIMHILLDKSDIEWYNIAVMKELLRVCEAERQKSCKELQPDAVGSRHETG